MIIEQALTQDIEDSKMWSDRTKEENTYKRDFVKKIELMDWVLENMKNTDIQICALIETRMNELIDEINKKDSILEADPLDGQVRILDWILYQFYSNEKRNLNGY